MNKNQIAYLRAFHRKRQYTAAKPFVLIELIKKYKDLSWIEWMRLRWRNSTWVSNYNELVERVSQNCNFQMAYMTYLPQTNTNFYWENHPHITEADITRDGCSFNYESWASANISVQFIFRIYGRTYFNFEFAGRYISKNPNVTMADVLNNPQIKWNSYELSRNPAFTLDDFRANPLIERSRPGLSLNPNVTMADFRRGMPWTVWNRGELSQNPNITINDILSATNDNFTGTWNFYDLSRFANITIEDIYATPHLPWNIKEFALRGKFPLHNALFNVYKKNIWCNPHFTLSDMAAAGIKIHKECDWDELSGNPNLTLDFIEEHLHELNIETLTRINKFLWDDVVYQRTIKEDIAARSTRVSKYLREFTNAMTAGVIAQYIDWT